MTRPELIVFAGPNGSGKSTLTQKWINQGFRLDNHLDPDAIAYRINPENVEAAALKAAREVIQKQKQFLESRVSFSFETTLSGKRELQIMQEAKERGYLVHLVYVGLNDPRQNIQRVASRVAKGGHDVPKDDIIRRYYRSMNHLPLAVGIADYAKIYDNRVNHTKMIEIKDKQIVYLDENIPQWLKQKLPDIKKELEQSKQKEVLKLIPNQVQMNELGRKSDILLVKCNQANLDQLKSITCKFAVIQKSGEVYIGIHKDDRDNPSLKQLIKMEKDRGISTVRRDDGFER